MNKKLKKKSWGKPSYKVLKFKDTQKLYQHINEDPYESTGPS